MTPRRKPRVRPQNTGEDGRRGHLAGVLRERAVTVRCHLLLHQGVVSFWVWTALLPLPPPLPAGPHLPPSTCAHTHHRTTQHTSCRSSLRGGAIAHCASNLGRPLSHFSLWLPIKGPWRTSLALKRLERYLTLTSALHCTAGVAPLANGQRCVAPNILPTCVCQQVQLTPTFLPSPPCLAPALGCTFPLGHRKAGRRGLSSLLHLPLL